MKDFKQVPKMKAEGSHYKFGGKVKKFEDGGSVSDESVFERGSPERAKERFQESVANRLKERFPASEPEKTDRRPFENSAQRGLRQLRTGTTGGLGGSGGVASFKGVVTNPNFNKKSGGLIKKRGK